jgi:hypothetical protein
MPEQTIKFFTVSALALGLLIGSIADVDARGGSRGGYSYSRGTSKCVGVCYGVPSTHNGLPRNTYVHGYVKKDGTVVQPYTRSSP